MHVLEMFIDMHSNIHAYFKFEQLRLLLSRQALSFIKLVMEGAQRCDRKPLLTVEHMEPL